MTAVLGQQYPARPGYREAKTSLGFDHYEGRTWQGWHHHATLVSTAHAFCTLQRLDPKHAAPE